MTDKKIITNIFYKIVAIFSKSDPTHICGNEEFFFQTYNDVYNELLKIKDPVYLHVLNDNLVNYIYEKDFLTFNVNTKDPVYFTKFIRLYIDHENHGNYIYRNMSKYVYFTYIKEKNAAPDETLEYLVNQFYTIAKTVNKNNKYSTEEAIQYNRLMVYLLTYIYMNNELLDKDKTIYLDTFKVMSENAFYDKMCLNGALISKDFNEEDDTKIHYIKKAINEALKEKILEKNRGN